MNSQPLHRGRRRGTVLPRDSLGTPGFRFPGGILTGGCGPLRSDWSEWSLLPLRTDYGWTTSPASSIPNFDNDISSLDDTGTNNVFFTLLVVFVACLTPPVLQA